MGVVRRQSIKRTVVSYLGVLIGTFSVLIIYPMAFDIYGMSQFIIASATLIIPFASLGVSRLTVRFFPDFRDEASRHHGFLGFLLMLAIAGFIVFGLILFLFRDYFLQFLEFAGMRKDVFWENRSVILIISFLLILNSILAQYASNFKRIVIPEIFNNLLIKIALPVLVVLYAYSLVDEDSFRYFYAFSYFIAFLGLVAYLTRLKQLSLKINLSFISRPLFREMMVYSAFNALSIIGYLLSFRIDNIMITSYLGYDSTGHYSFFSYIVNVIVIPYMSMVAITSPIISQSFKDNEITSVVKLYRQSSETLFIIGLFIIGGVWICMDALLEITGKASVLSPLKTTFLLLAAGQLINVTTGLTETIIGYSRYYRFNFYTMALLAVLNIAMNLYFIPRLGIVGAALATAISLACYNMIQCLFIYNRFSILPFSIVHLKVALVVIGAYLISSNIALNQSPVFEILIRGALFSLLFIVPVIYFKISEDVSKLWKDIVSKIKQ